jgi:ring-1,2-phenylacetyl-CoA epoxidase subunit PaaA
MPLEDYLAQGGMLSSPLNVSLRYRGELMRIMSSFVDSELAGAAGFADIINDCPGITEKIVAARLVAEKLDHAERVLNIMGTFGANTERYVTYHPWTERLPRDADIGATRQGADMRLSVFHYPLEGWVDSVVMNTVMGSAVTIQLGELAHVSYQPLAEAFRAILPRERRHADAGVDGLRKILEQSDNRPAVRSSLEYWRPRVAASFGAIASEKFNALSRLGIRHTSNADLLAAWEVSLKGILAELNID